MNKTIKSIPKAPVTSSTPRIEKLLEPAARATRRGDIQQINAVLAELQTLWKRNAKAADSSDEMARGMTLAIEGILGFALASAGADTRRSLVETRKHALPILHALGKKAREAARAGSSDTADRSIQMNELAEAVGIWPQNLSELIRSMNDCGLLNIAGQSRSRHVSITQVGAETLEAMKPGWQLLEVPRDNALDLGKRVREALFEAIAELRSTMNRSVAAEPRSTRIHQSPTEPRIGRGVPSFIRYEKSTIYGMSKDRNRPALALKTCNKRLSQQ